MTLTQEVLQHEVAQRIQSARGASSLPAAETETAVVCVLRRLDLAAFVAGTYTFAAGLPAECVAGWRRSFTRAIFLAGNPHNLRDRIAFHHTDPDGAIAWTRPAALDEHAAPRRLLRLFEGSGTLPSPATVTLPGMASRPVEHELFVATSGLTVGEYLVHVGHLLAEAVFDGALSGGDRIVVRHVPRLIGTPGPFEALRVAADPDDPERLRAYAGLARSRS